MKLFIFLFIFSIQNLFSIEVEKLKVNQFQEVDVVKGELIVEIEDGKKDEVIKEMNAIGYEEFFPLYKNFYLFKTKKNITTFSSLSLLSLKSIKAYPNKILKPSYLSNDPYLLNQYYLSKVNAFSGWDFEEYRTTVTVFVVDSGIKYDHEDLGSSVLYSTQVNVSVNPPNTISRQAPPFTTTFSHGTMVSGVIAAVRDNLKGISGVSKGVKIYSVNVFYGSSDGTTNSAAVVAGLGYINQTLSGELPGRKIVNLSLGAPGDCEPAIQSVINDLYNNGFIIVAAAGNEGMDGVDEPANCMNVVPVSAIDENDKLAYFSNYGNAMLNGVSACGVRIYTTIPEPDYYSFVDGTSFSSPIVAAACGMLWGKRPDLLNRDVIDIIKKTAYDIGSDGVDKKYGWGRVDVYKALSYLESDLTPQQINKDFLAWPNPFSISKDHYIKFSVKISALYPDDKLMIFDFAGNFVAYAKRDGVKGFIWDGKNDAGEFVAPGPYVGYYKSEKSALKTKFLLMK